ncbi:MAG: hypothetical protein ACPGOY_18130, partial [Rhodospirillaceae bacterium]
MLLGWLISLPPAWAKDVPIDPIGNLPEVPSDTIERFDGPVQILEIVEPLPWNDIAPRPNFFTEDIITFAAMTRQQFEAFRPHSREFGDGRGMDGFVTDLTGGGHVRLQRYAYDIPSRKTYWMSDLSLFCYNQETGDFLVQSGHYEPERSYAGVGWQLSAIADPKLHKPLRLPESDEVFAKCRYQKKPAEIPKHIPGVGSAFNVYLPNRDGHFVRNVDRNRAAAFDHTGRELFRLSKDFPISSLTQANFDGSYTIHDGRMAPSSFLFTDPATGKLRPAPEIWQESNCLWFMRFRV